MQCSFGNKCSRRRCPPCSSPPPRPPPWCPPAPLITDVVLYEGGVQVLSNCSGSGSSGGNTTSQSHHQTRLTFVTTSSLTPRCCFHPACDRLSRLLVLAYSNHITSLASCFFFFFSFPIFFSPMFLGISSTGVVQLKISLFHNHMTSLFNVEIPTTHLI